MSYDLAVFDPTFAPSSHAEFVKWFKQQTEWSDSHDYSDPDAPSTPLQAWFHDMIATYPPMNGPLASDDVDDPRLTDYSLDDGLIYVAFAWSEAKHAHAHMRTLAAKHNVGFADVSSEDFAVWLPSRGGLQPMK